MAVWYQNQKRSTIDLRLNLSKSLNRLVELAENALNDQLNSSTYAGIIPKSI